MANVHALAGAALRNPQSGGAGSAGTRRVGGEEALCRKACRMACALPSRAAAPTAHTCALDAGAALDGRARRA